MPKPSRHILELARRGAEDRLRELAAEAQRLLAAFPDLRDSFDPDELPVTFILAEGARQQSPPATGGRRRMSAAARRAVSERMKSYWEARRKGTQD